MPIFAFDISFDEINLALTEDDKILSEKKISAKNKQSEILVAEIKNFLSENSKNFFDIDLIVSTKGPASFTSVRISLTVAKIIQLAIKKPLLLFSSLEALMISNFDKNQSQFYLVSAQSRIDEFYFAVYRNKQSQIEQIIAEKIFDIEDLSIIKNFNPILIGNASNNFAEILAKKNISYQLKSFDLKPITISAATLAIFALKEFGQKKFDKIFFKENIASPLYLSEPNISKRKN